MFMQILIIADPVAFIIVISQKHHTILEQGIISGVLELFYYSPSISLKGICYEAFSVVCFYADQYQHCLRR